MGADLFLDIGTKARLAPSRPSQGTKASTGPSPSEIYQEQTEPIFERLMQEMSQAAARRNALDSMSRRQRLIQTVFGKRNLTEERRQLTAELGVLRSMAGEIQARGAELKVAERQGEIGAEQALLGSVQEAAVGKIRVFDERGNVKPIGQIEKELQAFYDEQQRMAQTEQERQEKVAEQRMMKQLHMNLYTTAAENGIPLEMDPAALGDWNSIARGWGTVARIQGQRFQQEGQQLTANDAVNLANFNGVTGMYTRGLVEGRGEKVLLRLPAEFAASLGVEPEREMTAEEIEAEWRSLMRGQLQTPTETLTTALQARAEQEFALSLGPRLLALMVPKPQKPGGGKGFAGKMASAMEGASLLLTPPMARAQAREERARQLGEAMARGENVTGMVPYHEVAGPGGTPYSAPDTPIPNFNPLAPAMVLGAMTAGRAGAGAVAELPANMAELFNVDLGPTSPAESPRSALLRRREGTESVTGTETGTSERGVVLDILAAARQLGGLGPRDDREGDEIILEEFIKGGINIDDMKRKLEAAAEELR